MSMQQMRIVQVSAAIALLWATAVQAGPIGYVYASNDSSPNAVSAFIVDASGALATIPGSPFSTGGNGSGYFFAGNKARVVQTAGRLYAANNDGIAGFNITVASGALTPVTGSPFAAGLDNVGSIAVTAAGNCLFAGSDRDGTIASFTIAADGSLTAAGTQPGVGSVDGMQLSPDGAYLLSALPNNSTISVFSVGAGCALTPVAGSPFAAPHNTTSLVFNASGSKLFGAMANGSQTQVGVYGFAGGVPAPIAGSPFSFASGANSNVAILRPAGDKLFVSNQSSGTVTVLNAAADGTLSLLSGSPFPEGGSTPTGMDMTPDGSLLFVANLSGSISVLSVAADGTPTAVAGSPFATAGQPYSVAFVNTLCGNGVLDPGEQCDDGNTAAGDGCSPLCAVEPCYSCTGVGPASCTPAPSGTACPDDGNVCTSDVCDGAGTCTHPGNVPAGTACPDDGNVCTRDVCDGAGTCTHPGDVPAGTACPDDGNVCTDDICDGAGTCTHPGVPAGTACPDDGNLCTDDICDGAGTCTHPNNTAPCNDGNACTQTDTCSGGSCVGGNPVDCTLVSQCQDQPVSCDPTSGACIACPAGYAVGGGGCQKIYSIDASLLDNLPSPCGNGNLYNSCSGAFGFHWTDTGDSSVGAVIGADLQIQAGISCSGTTRSVSLNGNPVGSYSPAGTCDCYSSHAARLLNGIDVTSYVKGGANAILTDDPGTCEGLSQDSNGFYAVVTVTYQAPPSALQDGTNCDDGNGCTQTDTCQSGVCTGGNPVVCAASDQCHDVGTCNPSTGTCSNPAVANGTTCNDGNLCTQTDTCQNGTCTGTNPVVCTALDQCHDVGTCNTGTGICSNPNKTDGSSCTNNDGCPGDTCQSGVCQAVACPNVDAVVLPPKPLNITIPKGTSSVSKTLTVTVRNADATDRTIQLDVDASHCPSGSVGTPRFGNGQNSISVSAGKTKTAKVPLTITGANFTSFNFKAPARCTLIFTASAVVAGGSNDPNRSNNVAVVELNVVNKHDSEQTVVHETTIQSAAPATVTIARGAGIGKKKLTAVLGNADYLPTAETPGDAVTLQASTTCTGLTLSPPVCDPSTASDTVTVKGGKSKTCKLTATVDPAQISTPNKLSPQRCMVSLTAMGPSYPETLPLDPSNGATELTIDITDKNDF